MVKICVIGDIHGRIKILQRIINEYLPQDYHIVILGDIIHHKKYFRRTTKTNPIRVIEYIMSLGGDVTTICGNNETYILERLNYPLKDIYKREAQYTISCLRGLDTQKRLNILRWMLNMPTKLELGKYRFAHAFYDDPNPRLFGPGERWFEPEKIGKYNIDPSYKYFIGHYGKPFFHNNIYCLDCTELEAVGVYLTDKNIFKVYD